MLSKHGMLALAVALAVAGSTFAQPGPKYDAHTDRVAPDHPFVKGQAQFDLVPAVYAGTTRTHVSPDGCYSYGAIGALRNEGIPIKANWQDARIVIGWNTNVWVEVMCYPNDNYALINVASIDGQIANSVGDRVYNYVANTICYEGCEPKK